MKVSRKDRTRLSLWAPTCSMRDQKRDARRAAKKGRNRNIRRAAKADTLDDGYGPPQPEPGICDCETCAPTYEVLTNVDKACRWE